MKIGEQSVMTQAISITAGELCLRLNAAHEKLDIISLDGDLGIQMQLELQLSEHTAMQALQPRVGESN
jgi:hypothetical protein